MSTKHMTPEQRAAYNARRRERYANDPDYKARVVKSIKKYQHNKSVRERYATDPEFRARRLAAAKEYYATHKEQVSAYKQERYANDPAYREACKAAVKRSRQKKQMAVTTPRLKTRPCLIAGVPMITLAKASGVSHMTIQRLVNKPEALSRQMRIKVLSSLVQYRG